MSASVQPAGIGVTVKATPFDTWLLTVTRTGPEDAPDGTTAVIAVVFQLMTEAVVPLKETVLVPWIEPKLTPPIVTEIPTKPDVGETPVKHPPPRTNHCIRINLIRKPDAWREICCLRCG